MTNIQPSAEYLKWRKSTVLWLDQIQSCVQNRNRNQNWRAGFAGGVGAPVGSGQDDSTNHLVYCYFSQLFHLFLLSHPFSSASSSSTSYSSSFSSSTCYSTSYSWQRECWWDLKDLRTRRCSYYSSWKFTESKQASSLPLQSAMTNEIFSLAFSSTSPLDRDCACMSLKSHQSRNDGATTASPLGWQQLEPPLCWCSFNSEIGELDQFSGC